MTTFEYLNTEETNRRRELRYGRVSEPPAPFFSHQVVVLRIARALCEHVEPLHLGVVGLSPIDVVLDAERSLIVQPDVLFISAARRSIVRNQVWGAPDLVIEVLSAGTEAHDDGEKLGWYQKYGVRECWLVDPANRCITIVTFADSTPVRTVIDQDGSIRSSVLPALQLPVSPLFDR